MSAGYPPGPPQQPQNTGPYASMLSQLPQQGGQQNYLQALGQGPQAAPPQMGQGQGMGQRPPMGQMPPMSQGRPSYGPSGGMPSNGQGPGQANPFLQAIARWHAQQGGQGQPGGQQPQWGPNPIPQGMRGPGTMPGAAPPPWAGQNVQWGPPVQMRQPQGPQQFQPPGPLASNGPGNR